MEELRRKSRIAILASGVGSNAEAMLKHFAEGSGAEVAEVVWVCTNRAEAKVRAVAKRFGVVCQSVPTDLRSATDPNLIAEALRADCDHRIKAVMQVHTDTSTGVCHDIAAVRAAIEEVVTDLPGPADA